MWFGEYLLLFWVCLVSIIVFARLSRWPYAFMVLWLGVYIPGPEFSMLTWGALLILDCISLVVWQHHDKLHAFASFNAQRCHPIPSTRPGSLTLINCLGEEKHHIAPVTVLKPTSPVSLGYRPPRSWRRKPGDWNISLLVSRPGGIAPNICFDITPPNGKTGDVVVETLPHEGEKKICVQFKLGEVRDLGSGTPVSDQHFWSALTLNTSKGKDVTDTNAVDERKQVKAEERQTIDWQKKRMC